MIKREVFLFSLVLLLFVISSCVENPQGGAVPKGIEMQFVEGYPDDVLTEDDSFNINLEMISSLTDSVSYSVCVYGDRSDYYGGVPVSGVCKDGLDMPAAYENQDGAVTPTKVELVFPEETSSFFYTNLDKGVSGANIRALLQYPINSEASAEVCVLRNRADESRSEPICLAKESISSFNIVQKSSPLIVSKIEKEIRDVGGNAQMIVSIYLDKTNEGEIVRQVGEQFDLIGLDLSLRGTTDTHFTCLNQNENGLVIFEKGKAVVCKSDYSANANFYKDNLIVELSYVYQLEKKKHVSFDSGWEE